MENTITNIAKGVGISLIATFILLLIFATILTYTQISETIINPVIIIITAISILIGSSIGNTKIKKNGLVNGALIGGIYIITIYLISSILNWKFGLEMQSIIILNMSFTNITIPKINEILFFCYRNKIDTESINRFAVLNWIFLPIRNCL